LGRPLQRVKEGGRGHFECWLAPHNLRIRTTLSETVMSKPSFESASLITEAVMLAILEHLHAKGEARASPRAKSPRK